MTPIAFPLLSFLSYISRSFPSLLRSDSFFLPLTFLFYTLISFSIPALNTYTHSHTRKHTTFAYMHTRNHATHTHNTHTCIYICVCVCLCELYNCICTYTYTYVCITSSLTHANNTLHTALSQVSPKGKEESEQWEG